MKDEKNSVLKENSVNTQIADEEIGKTVIIAQQQERKRFDGINNTVKPVHVKGETTGQTGISSAKYGYTLTLYGISKVLLGLVGIGISLVSLIPLIDIIITAIKNTAYIGNEPYYVAVVITFIISVSILGWGIKIILSGYTEIRDYRLPAPGESEIFATIEDVFIKKRIFTGKTSIDHMRETDKRYIIGILVFIGFLLLFFVGKNYLPKEIFWNLGLMPQYFSLPVRLMILLTAVVVLRGASLYYHNLILNREMKTGYVLKSINSNADPNTFVSTINNELVNLQSNGKPNLFFFTGFSGYGNKEAKKGKIHGKLIIETYPEFTPSISPFFIYVDLLFAILLTGIGFIFMSKLPPENISVLSVPRIFLGYVWFILKGTLLVYNGLGLLKSISLQSGIRKFKSTIVYIDIIGEKFQQIYDFSVFSAKLLTEMNTFNGNRQIINIAVEKESEMAKIMVANAIESFNM